MTTSQLRADADRRSGAPKAARRVTRIAALAATVGAAFAGSTMAAATNQEARKAALDCRRLEPLSGAFGYQRRGESERCEGFYQAPVAADPFDVVSALTTELEFDVASAPVLWVDAPAPLSSAVRRLGVVGLALSANTYYRMDAAVVPGELLRWPTADVLAPAGLRDRDIGVYGWAETSDGTIYVPVAVRTGPAPPDRRDPPRAVVVLRASTALDGPVWRLRDPEGVPGAWQELASAPLAAGELMSLALPAGPTQVIELEFAAVRAATGRWLRQNVRIWRPAS